MPFWLKTIARRFFGTSTPPRPRTAALRLEAVEPRQAPGSMLFEVGPDLTGSVYVGPPAAPSGATHYVAATTSAMPPLAAASWWPTIPPIQGGGTSQSGDGGSGGGGSGDPDGGGAGGGSGGTGGTSGGTGGSGDGGTGGTGGSGGGSGGGSTGGGTGGTGGTGDGSNGGGGAGSTPGGTPVSPGPLDPASFQAGAAVSLPGGIQVTAEGFSGLTMTQPLSSSVTASGNFASDQLEQADGSVLVSQTTWAFNRTETATVAAGGAWGYQQTSSYSFSTVTTAVGSAVPLASASGATAIAFTAGDDGTTRAWGLQISQSHSAAWGEDKVEEVASGQIPVRWNNTSGYVFSRNIVGSVPSAGGVVTGTDTGFGVSTSAASAQSNYLTYSGSGSASQWSQGSYSASRSQTDTYAFAVARNAASGTVGGVYDATHTASDSRSYSGSGTASFSGDPSTNEGYWGSGSTSESGGASWSSRREEHWSLSPSMTWRASSGGGSASGSGWASTSFTASGTYRALNADGIMMSGTWDWDGLDSRSAANTFTYTFGSDAAWGVTGTWDQSASGDSFWGWDGTGLYQYASAGSGSGASASATYSGGGSGSDRGHSFYDYSYEQHYALASGSWGVVSGSGTDTTDHLNHRDYSGTGTYTSRGSDNVEVSGSWWEDGRTDQDLVATRTHTLQSNGSWATTATWDRTASGASNWSWSGSGDYYYDPDEADSSSGSPSAPPTDYYGGGTAWESGYERSSYSYAEHWAQASNGSWSATSGSGTTDSDRSYHTSYVGDGTYDSPKGAYGTPTSGTWDEDGVSDRRVTEHYDHALPLSGSWGTTGTWKRSASGESNWSWSGSGDYFYDPEAEEETGSSPSDSSSSSAVADPTVYEGAGTVWESGHSSWSYSYAESWNRNSAGSWSLASGGNAPGWGVGSTELHQSYAGDGTYDTPEGFGAYGAATSGTWDEDGSYDRTTSSRYSYVVVGSDSWVTTGEWTKSVTGDSNWSWDGDGEREYDPDEEAESGSTESGDGESEEPDPTVYEGSRDVWESGHRSYSYGYDERWVMNAASSWSVSAGVDDEGEPNEDANTGWGVETSVVHRSYSGDGTYTTPKGFGAYGASISGSWSEDGRFDRTTVSNYDDTLNPNGSWSTTVTWDRSTSGASNWSWSGSGSYVAPDSHAQSGSGSHVLVESSASADPTVYEGSGTVWESGFSSWSYSYDEHQERDAAKSWSVIGGSGWGSGSTLLHQDYNGGGTYTTPEGFGAYGEATSGGWNESGSYDRDTTTGIQYTLLGDGSWSETGDWNRTTRSMSNWSWSGTGSYVSVSGGPSSDSASSSSSSGTADPTLYVGSGSVSESGARYWSDSFSEDWTLASNSWYFVSGTGWGSGSAIDHQSYSGGGTYDSPKGWGAYGEATSGTWAESGNYDRSASSAYTYTLPGPSASWAGTGTWVETVTGDTDYSWSGSGSYVTPDTMASQTGSGTYVLVESSASADPTVYEGSGTVWESGRNSYSYGYNEHWKRNSAGTWSVDVGTEEFDANTGWRQRTVETHRSYSGSGTYDTPDGFGAYGEATSGTWAESGNYDRVAVTDYTEVLHADEEWETTATWDRSTSGATSWSWAGSGDYVTPSASASASQSGSSSAASGSGSVDPTVYVGSGSVWESGYSSRSYSYDEHQEMDADEHWSSLGGSGSSVASRLVHRSYSGGGTYTTPKGFGAYGEATSGSWAEDGRFDRLTVDTVNEVLPAGSAASWAITDQDWDRTTSGAANWSWSGSGSYVRDPNAPSGGSGSSGTYVLVESSASVDPTVYTGSGTVWESGHSSYSYIYDEHQTWTPADSWTVTGGWGTDDDTLAVHRSYSGSGTYLSPEGAYGVETSGTWSEDGHYDRTTVEKSTHTLPYDGSWSTTVTWDRSTSGADNWSRSGSGFYESETEEDSGSSASSSALSIFQASGDPTVYEGTRTVWESMVSSWSYSYDESQAWNAASSWRVLGGSGWGVETVSVHQSYSGGGTYDTPKGFGAYDEATSGTWSESGAFDRSGVTNYTDVLPAGGTWATTASWDQSTSGNDTWSWDGSGTYSYDPPTSASAGSSSSSSSSYVIVVVDGSADPTDYHGGGTVWESGFTSYAYSYDEHQEMDEDEEWWNLGGSGWGSGSGEVHTSYSGSGSYETPEGWGAYGVATSGTWSEDGRYDQSTSSRYADTLDEGELAEWVTTGSWSKVASGHDNFGWSGSGEYSYGPPASASGGDSQSAGSSGTYTGVLVPLNATVFTGGGTVWESGHTSWSYSSDERWSMDASSSWSVDESASGNTGWGSGSAVNHQSYSGSGDYYSPVGAYGVATSGTWSEDGSDDSESSSRYSYSLDASESWAATGTWESTASGTSKWSWSGSGSYTFDPPPASSSGSSGSSGSSSSTVIYESAAAAVYHGGGTVWESGFSSWSYSYSESWAVDEYDHWTVAEGDEGAEGDGETNTGWGSGSGLVHQSYSGSGTYTVDYGGGFSTSGTWSHGGSDDYSTSEEYDYTLLTSKSWATEGDWHGSGSGSANFSWSGSGTYAIDDTPSSDGTVYTGSGTANESGVSSWSYSYSEDWHLPSGSTAWAATGGSGWGSSSDSAHFDYSASGGYATPSGTYGVAVSGSWSQSGNEDEYSSGNYTYTLASGMSASWATTGSHDATASYGYGFSWSGSGTETYSAPPSSGSGSGSSAGTGSMAYATALGLGGGSWGSAYYTGGSRTESQWGSYSDGGTATYNWTLASTGSWSLASATAATSYSFDTHSRLSGSGSYDRVVDSALTLHGTWTDSASADRTEWRDDDYALGTHGVWVGTGASGHQSLSERNSYAYSASGSYEIDTEVTSGSYSSTTHADRNASENDSASASYSLVTDWQLNSAGALSGTQTLSASASWNATWTDNGGRGWTARQSGSGSSGGWSGYASNSWSGSGGASGSWSESFTATAAYDGSVTLSGTASGGATWQRHWTASASSGSANWGGGTDGSGHAYSWSNSFTYSSGQSDHAVTTQSWNRSVPPETLVGLGSSGSASAGTHLWGGGSWATTWTYSTTTFQASASGSASGSGSGSSSGSGTASGVIVASASYAGPAGPTSSTGPAPGGTSGSGSASGSGGGSYVTSTSTTTSSGSSSYDYVVAGSAWGWGYAGAWTLGWGGGAPLAVASRTHGWVQDEGIWQAASGSGGTGGGAGGNNERSTGGAGTGASGSAGSGGQSGLSDHLPDPGEPPQYGDPLRDLLYAKGGAVAGGGPRPGVGSNGPRSNGSGANGGTGTSSQGEGTLHVIPRYGPAPPTPTTPFVPRIGRGRTSDSLGLGVRPGIRELGFGGMVAGHWLGTFALGRVPDVSVPQRIMTADQWVERLRMLPMGQGFSVSDDEIRDAVRNTLPQYRMGGTPEENGRAIESENHAILLAILKKSREKDFAAVLAAAGNLFGEPKSSDHAANVAKFVQIYNDLAYEAWQAADYATRGSAASWMIRSPADIAAKVEAGIPEFAWQTIWLMQDAERRLKMVLERPIDDRVKASKDLWEWLKTLKEGDLPGVLDEYNLLMDRWQRLLENAPRVRVPEGFASKRAKTLDDLKDAIRQGSFVIPYLADSLRRRGEFGPGAQASDATPAPEPKPAESGEPKNADGESPGQPGKPYTPDVPRHIGEHHSINRIRPSSRFGEGNRNSPKTIARGDIDLGEDEVAINAGQGKLLPNGDILAPSGRVYGRHTDKGETGIFPRSGSPGTVDLNQAEFKLLTEMIRSGGLDPDSNARKMHDGLLARKGSGIDENSAAKLTDLLNSRRTRSPKQP